MNRITVMIQQPAKYNEMWAVHLAEGKGSVISKKEQAKKEKNVGHLRKYLTDYFKSEP